MVMVVTPIVKQMVPNIVTQNPIHARTVLMIVERPVLRMIVPPVRVQKTRFVMVILDYAIHVQRMIADLVSVLRILVLNV